MNLLTQIRTILFEALPGPDNNRNRGWVGHGQKDQGRREVDARTEGVVKTFTVFGAWRSSCRTAPGFSKFVGDEESGCIAEFYGPKDNLCVASWDGKTGTGTLKSSGRRGALAIADKSNRVNRITNPRGHW